ncbi:MAG: hypothetical protein CMH83_03680 [Nocardioides sp.]|nr:hypothetical protein [Nocardioides sp.]
MTARLLIGAVGVLAGLYGALLLLERTDDLVPVLLWVAGGVVLHDGVLAPLALLLAVLVLPRLPYAARTPAAAVALVLGSVTVWAVPVLGGWGRREDNPTLLDRDYWLGWGGLVVAGLAVVLVWTVLRLRAGERDRDAATGEDA